MKKLNLIISILTLTMLFTAFAPMTNAIGASPLRVQLEAAPGETVEGMVRAQNSKDEDQVVVLMKGDFLVDEKEDLQFMYEYDETNKWSLQNWLDLNENNIPVGPNESVEIKYQIEVPQDAASQSYYGVVFVQSQDPEIFEGLGGVGVQANVAQLVLLEVTGDLKSDVEVKDMKLVEENAGHRFETTVFNNGNTHDASTGTIIVTDSKLNILEELDFNKAKHNALPETQKNYIVMWEKFAEYEAGIYYAYLNVNDENNEYLSAELKFEITDQAEIEILNLKIGRSYTEAKAAYTDIPVIPLVIIGFALIVGLIAKTCCRKKRKTKK
ncbi:hypothetical protein ACFLZH_00725 [Patescibacteria group bacterium]